MTYKIMYKSQGSNMLLKIMRTFFVLHSLIWPLTCQGKNIILILLYEKRSKIKRGMTLKIS